METVSLSTPILNASSLESSSEEIHYNLSFLLYGPLLQFLGSLLLVPWIPFHVQTSKARSNKWRSTWLARLSAGITGVWAVITLHDSYSLRADLMDASSQMAINLLLFSLGVHIAETLDMVITSNFSLLSVHHIAVIITFAGAVLSQQAIGFAVLTLVTELNAVTNKTRILHIISDTNKKSLEYRVNAITNLTTFFIRILIIFWMNNQSFIYFINTPCLFFGCSAAGLLFVNLWNLTVFRTIIVKDVLSKPKEQ